MYERVDFLLHMIFGMTFTNITIYLHYGHRIIVEIFQIDAQIKIPSTEQIE